MSPVDAMVVDALGYSAAGLVFLSFCMKTMLSLRLIAIASNVAFLVYALAGGLTPILVLHGALLPLNLVRLLQMQRQMSAASKAARMPEDHDQFDWLVPLGIRRALPAGAMLFRKGDLAESLFIVVKGEVVLPEVRATVGPGAMIGEISLFSGDNRRTASAQALTAVELAELTEQRVQQLYFDNPHFAYKLIRLITGRLVDHLSLLEQRAEAAFVGGSEPNTAIRDDVPG